MYMHSVYYEWTDFAYDDIKLLKNQSHFKKIGASKLAKLQAKMSTRKRSTLQQVSMLCIECFGDSQLSYNRSKSEKYKTDQIFQKQFVTLQGLLPDDSPGSAEQQQKRQRAARLGLLSDNTATPGNNAASPSPPPQQATAPLPVQPPPTLADPSPDVFAFFAQRTDEKRELEQKVKSLAQRESQLATRLSEAEMAASRSRTEAASAIAQLQAREEQFQHQQDRLVKELHKEADKVAKLQQQLQQATTQQGLSSPAAAAAHQVQQQQQQQQQAQLATPEKVFINKDELVQLRISVTRLEMAVEQAKLDKEEAERRGHERAEEERHKAESALQEAVLLRMQLTDTLEMADRNAVAKRECDGRIAQLERQMMVLETAATGRSTLLNQEGGNAGDGGADREQPSGTDALIRTLRHQLEEQRPLVTEALRLREQASNVHVLKERLGAAEARARMAQESLDQMTAVSMEGEQAKQVLKRWTGILSGAADCHTPEDVLHLLTRLQQQRLTAETRVGDRADEIATLRAEVASAEAARREALAAQAGAEALVEDKDKEVERLERKVALLNKERDGLKAVLSSYDEEYLNRQGDRFDGEVTPEQQRIVELEATVEALHAHIKSIEEESRAAGTADGNNHSSPGGDMMLFSSPDNKNNSAKRAAVSAAIADAESRAATAESKVTSLLAEVSALNQQIAMLETKVARGEFNPALTRVLHFKNNPETVLEREMQRARVAHLESENEALKSNLARLEVAVGSGGDGGNGDGDNAAANTNGPSAGVRIAQLEGENLLLSRRLAEVQKVSDRLQQVFTKQIGTFREAVLLLFGYRVDMSTDPGQKEYRAKFILTPPSHHDDDDNNNSKGAGSLVFLMLRDGSMTLQESGATSQVGKLAREVETFIKRFKSIPAFTANLTMENFQKHTQA
jgi:mitotic spindle assembly checkpoint protein MAD1